MNDQIELWASYWAFALAAAGSVYGLTVFFGKHLSPEQKESLTLWLWGEYDSTWSHHFCNLFDTVFGKNHLTLNCFFRSSIASVISVFFLYFFFTHITGVTTSRAAGNISVWQALLFGIAINIIPDYLSLFETRWLLKKFEKVNSFSGQLSILAVDAIFSGIIIYIFINTFRLWLGSSIISAVEMAALFSVFSIFFYSTFITSVWAWIYCISTWIMRIFSRTKLKSILDTENHPVPQIALVGSTFIFLISLLTTPAISTNKMQQVSAFDELLCHVFSSDVCPHVARLTPDAIQAMAYLAKACEGGATEHCQSIDAETLSNAPNFVWPVRGRIVSKFGKQRNGSENDGINISVETGTPVRAVGDGVVAYAGDELKGFGNLILVRHESNWVTAYAHNEELLVVRGDEVASGQIIAKAGSTGSVSFPQLHFELRYGSTAVDPLLLLKEPSLSEEDL